MVRANLASTALRGRKPGPLHVIAIRMLAIAVTVRTQSMSQYQRRRLTRSTETHINDHIISQPVL